MTYDGNMEWEISRWLYYYCIDGAAGRDKHGDKIPLGAWVLFSEAFDVNTRMLYSSIRSRFDHQPFGAPQSPRLAWQTAYGEKKSKTNDKRRKIHPSSKRLHPTSPGRQTQKTTKPQQKTHPPYLRSGTPHNLEIRLPLITHRIRRTPQAHLPGTRPPLIRRTVPRPARETPAPGAPPPVVDRPRPDPDVPRAALHDAHVVRRALFAGVAGVSEFEERLVHPLSVGPGLRGAGEAHPRGVEVRVEGVGLAVREGDGRGALEHLEGGGHGVGCEVFCRGAVVPEVDGEGGRVGAVAVAVAVGLGGRAGGEGGRGGLVDGEGGGAER